MSIRFNTLLLDAGVDPAQVRLLRHQDTRAIRGKSVYRLWREDLSLFETYQAWQPLVLKPRLAGKYWAVFVNDQVDATLFVGLYELRSSSPATGMMNPLNGEQMLAKGETYDLERTELLAAFIGRLCIEWGAASRARAQRADRQNKVVAELRRQVEEPPFPGHLAFVKPLSEIRNLPAAWRTQLKQAKGVYLLTCPQTREQYVGSASGEDGFLARWLDYVATGHGGNVALKSRDLSDYQISILEIAGSSASAESILRMETLWKQKLQSVEMGLNRNR